MKKSYFLFYFFFLVMNFNVFSQTLVTSVEAETGVLTGVQIAPQTGSSSGPYVTGFDAAGDKLTVIVSVPSAGNYKMGIRYRSLYGAKVQDIYANDVFVAGVNFLQTADFVELAAGTVALNAGQNTLSMVKNWGYMDVDKFNIYTVPVNVFNITNALTDPLASDATKNLYAFLRSQFGHKIITGQTDGYYDQVKTLTGKSPLLRSWDMASYSPSYAYKWENGGHVFGAVDNQDAEKAIAWYNGTSRKGIVNFHWHWHSPSGGTAGTNTFYTDYTSFDVSKAVINGTAENMLVIRDIDAIAVQLKKLSNADIPVLWRPLHEAGGGWFWWGAKGSAPAKALYDIMYDRLTNFHGLHNLIWEWSTPEPDWYPGNAKVDMLGYDSYPGVFNYTTQKNVFDNLYTITGGQKILAMSENGPIPDIQACFDMDAAWSYFMSWNDLLLSQNSNQHIIDAFNNSKAITLENYDLIVLPVSLTRFTARLQGSKTIIEWLTTIEQNHDHFELEKSLDGIHFNVLASIKANHNSASSRPYLLYDESPAKGINYYRLVQVDKDGKKTEHGVRTINYNTGTAASVRAYPNPSAGRFGILLSNYTGKTISLIVNDPAGKQVAKQVLSTAIGSGYYEINLSVHLPAGIYTLQLKGEGLNEIIKLVRN